MSRSSSRSKELFSRAQAVIPGGVNSPVRAFKGVGGHPLFIRSGRGCRVEDVDGNGYVDYLGSWGPLVLGHAHPEVVEAVREAAGRGTSYGAPTELEVRLAETICRLVPSVEKVRLVNSGTEATMSALRLARAFTGRSLIVKFDGCYHGHTDSLLVQAGSGIATLGIPGTPGIPSDFTELTLSLPFHDLQALESVFRKYPDRLAAVILEPVPANMGVVPPDAEFLRKAIELSGKHGALVVFDEVMSGFRLAPGGAQEVFGLLPDLTCLGKIVGGGLPIGAYGGRREIMELVAPEGPVYQAGTLSGNPIAVTAGLKTLEILERERPYESLDRWTDQLCRGISSAARRHGVPLQVQRCGSMFTPFFHSQPVRDFENAVGSDSGAYGRFFHHLLEQGVYFAPSQFEASFVSTAHRPEIIAETVEKAEVAFRKMALDNRSE